MQFEFTGSGRIVFGPGTVHRVPEMAADFGSRVLLVTGSDPARHTGLRQGLRDAGLGIEQVTVSGEPTVEWARTTLAAVRVSGCDVVVACGGGSVLDGSKALAGLIPNPGDVLDYLEVVGRGLPLEHPAKPVIAVPTTAGTGSEVTRNAVLTDLDHRVKASLRHPSMIPRAAVVDPVLTLGMSSLLTAGTGMDALAQLIEPYVCRRSQPITDLLCEEGIRRIARSLRAACHQSQELGARTDLALAALFSGLALANAGLGAVHGLAAPLGGLLRAPHGPVCAALLAAVIEVNLWALRSRDSASPVLARYSRVAQLLTGHADASAAGGFRWIRDLVSDLSIPGLGHWGLSPAEFGGVVAQARTASSMRANPVELSDRELLLILERSL
jgi:alcohol dehydrogenase class IV